MLLYRHQEHHRLSHMGWLRAAVLGANDGIVSTVSLLMGMIAANASLENSMLAGCAGLAAGAMAMATGEFVSVSAQADGEKAALAQERAELRADYAHELRELAEIYEQRGLTPELAQQVAQQLMQHDALAAHARDELHIDPNVLAQPLQAAIYSAISFSAGAGIPLVVMQLTGVVYTGLPLMLVLGVTALLALAGLGGLSAYISRANVLPSVIRIVNWSSLAMLVTASVGHWAGVVV